MMAKFLVSENMVTISPSQGLRITDPAGKQVWHQPVTAETLTDLANECLVKHHKGDMPKFHFDLACRALDVAREMGGAAVMKKDK